jgi:thiol-disulfide isomerase/thioredoxin
MRVAVLAFAVCVLFVASAFGSADVVELGERDTGRIQKFGKVVGGSKPTLVFFYLPGCGHCRGFKPEFHEAAEHFASADVVFAKVNIERWDELAREYGVERVPDIRYCPVNSKKCERYPEFQPNTASGVIDYLSGKVGARFSQTLADAPKLDMAAIAATKGTCEVHAGTPRFAEAEEESVEEAEEEDTDEEADEAEEAADEEVDEESDEESGEEVDEEVDEESEEEVDAEADEEDVAEADEESADEGSDEEGAEFEDENEDAHEEDALSDEAVEDQNMLEMSSFLEVAHTALDESYAAFREENAEL